MRKRLFVAALVVAGVTAAAQERADRTLLSQEQMNAIINEASGERAMHHVQELVMPSSCAHLRNTRGTSAKAR